MIEAGLQFAGSGRLRLVGGIWGVRRGPQVRVYAANERDRRQENTALEPRAHLLPFRFELVLQHLSPLLGLPDLIGILVFVHRKELLIGLERRLNLMQLIVAKRANEPCPRAGLLDFGDDIEARKR